MVRTILTPDHANIKLAIPQSYVGKQLEVLVYTVDEVQTEPIAGVLVEPKLENDFVPKKPSDFKKILSDETAQGFHEYLKQSRNEWRDRI